MILFTDEEPVVEATPQRDRVAKPYRGRFWSARSHVMHALADSQSPAMRARAARHTASEPCPACQGSGLTPD